MLKKKQIRAIFLFEFKMSRNAAQTTHNINNAFGSGTANKGTGQQWFSKFCKRDERLENEECSGWSLEVDDQLRAITEVDPLKTTGEVTEEFNIDYYKVIWHLQQIGKVKILDKWVPHELTANQKDHCFEVSSSATQQTTSQLDCDMWWKVDFIQLVQWMDWEAAPKHFSRPNLYQKRSWSLSDGLLPVWSTTAFWITVKPLHLRSKQAQHIDEMHQKLQRLQPTLVNKMGPILHENATTHLTTNASEVEQTGLWSFASSAIFTWPLVNQLLLQASQQLFAGKMILQLAGGRKY